MGNGENGGFGVYSVQNRKRESALYVRNYVTTVGFSLDVEEKTFRHVDNAGNIQEHEL